MPATKWRSFLLAAALSACVFAILPLSIAAGRKGGEPAEISAVRAIPIKALPVGEAAKRNRPPSGVPALRAPNFGRAHAPLRFAEPSANPDFSALAVSAPGLPGDFSGNFEFADFASATASPEAVAFELSLWLAGGGSCASFISANNPLTGNLWLLVVASTFLSPIIINKWHKHT